MYGTIFSINVYVIPNQKEASMKKSILIVEDDKNMNEIICDYLDTSGFITYQAYDGIEALSLFSKHTIDLVILDIMMPHLDGWSVCRRLRQKSDVLIVMLSARSDEDDKLMGFDIGADEYVTKPFSPKVLAARITAMLSRQSAATTQGSTQFNIIKKGICSIDIDRHQVLVNNELVPLTSKEFDLLVLLAENEQKVYRREAIINALWGYDYIGDGRVVDTNIKTLRKKLGDGAIYIQTVIGVGYKFEVIA